VGNVGYNVDVTLEGVLLDQSIAGLEWYGDITSGPGWDYGSVCVLPDPSLLSKIQPGTSLSECIYHIANYYKNKQFKSQGCAYFVSTVLRHCGLNIKCENVVAIRSIININFKFTDVSDRDIKRGDIVGYLGSSKHGDEHIGIAISNTQVHHVSSSLKYRIGTMSVNEFKKHVGYFALRAPTEAARVDYCAIEEHVVNDKSDNKTE